MRRSPATSMEKLSVSLKNMNRKKAIRSAWAQKTGKNESGGESRKITTAAVLGLGGLPPLLIAWNTES